MGNEKYGQVLAWWREKGIKTDAQLAEVLNGHSIAFAYNSGKIENPQITYNDTREVFEHDGVTSYTGDLRTLFEIRNAKIAYEFFLESFNVHHNFNEDFLKRLQKLLTQNTYDTRRWQLGERPGEYKHHDYVTGREEVGALPQDVPEEMGELLAEIGEVIEKGKDEGSKTSKTSEASMSSQASDTSKTDVALIAAAYFHVKFENIHPFADGNGRTGRLAMNYLLLLLNHPPIIIHEEDRKDYYTALEAWDTDQTLDTMVEFLQSQAIKTWEKRVFRI